MATIGASVSAGFGNDLPLAKLLERAIRVEHETILNAARGLFFLQPTAAGRGAIDRCLARRPTLVIGVDFLFWYAYGLAPRREKEIPRRLERLERGLAQLERLACPVVVGDIPDMRGAHPRMLHPVMIPSPEALAALNEKLAAWAAARPNVLVLPLAAWVKQMRAGRWRVPASRDGKHPAATLPESVAMQWDRLHPSRLGTVALGARLVAALRKHFGPAAAGLDLDPWEVARELGLLPAPRPAPAGKKPGARRPG